MTASPKTVPLDWHIGPRRSIALDRPRLMGVLNATPDSFSDGGRWVDQPATVARGLEMVEQGASIIDIGGESSRPGAARVPVAEQIRRTADVIAGIRRESEVAISIDTTAAAVAEAAIHAGADIINDIAAGEEDEAIFTLAAATGCGLILMHRPRPSPQESFSDEYPVAPAYADVTASVGAYLTARCDLAIAAGVAPERIVIDPGLGFGKTVPQNYRLIGEIGRLMELGYPVLSAASRKSFIGAVSDEGDPTRRVAGSVAISVLHYREGIRLFRVHDLVEHAQALAVAAAAAKNQCG